MKPQKIESLTTTLKILIYGRSGTGKTTFLSTTPKPLLVLDVNERGLLPLKNSPDTFFLSIENVGELVKAFDYIEKEGKNFATIAIDSISSLQDLMFREKALGKSTIPQRVWGEIAANMKTILLQFRNLPQHIIFTAQDRHIVDDSDSDMVNPEVIPNLIPSVSKFASAIVDVIVQTFIREEAINVSLNGERIEKNIMRYSLRVGPHNKYLTKIRRSLGGDKLPDTIKPRFDSILKLIEGGIE